ncbi:hypothetical protein AVEN_236350-1 [Araneus ventricosus]|uniref:Uncharacterized protein n=1 Tax=Araneus ventricosus TaxID=182803 RepID=A0A4Y2TNX4_ARAVE|nr:hypothetical protein AVEN_1464-1 [Araneus ventricosus]GBO02248.1 hypothetical protein AVEN_236350-1 [Araneus ventricosus]
MKNAIYGKNSPDLATLYDMLETRLRALESLGRTKERFADFLEPLVDSCLPDCFLRAWEQPWSCLTVGFQEMLMTLQVRGSSRS